MKVAELIGVLGNLNPDADVMFGKWYTDPDYNIDEVWFYDLEELYVDKLGESVIFGSEGTKLDDDKRAKLLRVNIKSLNENSKEETIS